MSGAFNRFTTKVRQAVTDAEKTEIAAELKEGLRQFEETKTLGDHMKEATTHALPIVGSGKMTRIENLGTVLKQAAAKYGLDKPEAQGLQHAGDMWMAIGKEERALLAKAEKETHALYKQTHDYYDTVKKEKSRLETTATDMDGAKLKLKSSNKDMEGAKNRASSTTRAYETQRGVVENVVATLPEHRDKQRQAAKQLAEAQRAFYMKAAEIIEQHMESLGA